MASKKVDIIKTFILRYKWESREIVIRYRFEFNNIELQNW